jgi:hypothetical protein
LYITGNLTLDCRSTRNDETAVASRAWTHSLQLSVIGMGFGESLNENAARRQDIG